MATTKEEKMAKLKKDLREVIIRLKIWWYRIK